MMLFFTHAGVVMLKKISCGIAVLLTVALITWFGVKDALTPIKREHVQEPVFTIGDLTYAEALAKGKNVIKFGPAFWGMYPGGIAFTNAKEAEDYIKSNTELLNTFSEGWGIYELSGDFALDTDKSGDRHYTNKSLFVIRTITTH